MTKSLEKLISTYTNDIIECSELPLKIVKKLENKKKKLKNKDLKIIEKRSALIIKKREKLISFLKNQRKE